MKILAVSDKEDIKLQDFILKKSQALKGLDFIISCGDLSRSYLEFLVDSLKKEINSQIIDIQKKGFPIGWNNAEKEYFNSNVLLRLLGWLITAIALSFGAPFWFETLNKLVNIRKTGIKPLPITTK